MRPIRILYLGILLLSAIILGIAVLLFSSFEDRIHSLRTGYLFEVTQALSGSFSEALSQRDSSASGVLRNRFQDFESLSSTSDFDVSLNDHPMLHLIATDAEGRVVYDSKGELNGASIADWGEVQSALGGKRKDRDVTEEGGVHRIRVAVPLYDQGQRVGVLMASKTNQLLKPLVNAVEEGLLLMLVAIGLLVLIALMMVYLMIHRRIERWLIQFDAGHEPIAILKPPLRRTEFGPLGQLLDRMHESISGKRQMEHMVACLAHELKNPLGAVRMHLELLNRTDTAEQRTELIEKIRTANQRMTDIMTRLLDVGAIERRESLQSSSEFTVAVLLQSVKQRASSLAKSAHVTLEIILEADGTVHGDQILIEQALGNLVQNAIDYSRPGGTVTIKAMMERERWIFHIRDHGDGIPEVVMAHVFDKYFSTPKRTTGRKGTGIGLSMVQEVADLHQGEIALLNHRDGGVLAVFSLAAR
jgi:two-component system, OmpR family, sensor histidine kinase CreC